VTIMVPGHIDCMSRIVAMWDKATREKVKGSQCKNH
jgi:hypothetical protein